MRILLLLAGRSQRFWPLQEKSLWPFLGKTLLAHQLERLRKGGLTDITFVGGQHNLEHLYTLFPDVPLIQQEDLTLGMRGALLSALPQVGDEPVCIVSGNDVIDPEGYATLRRAGDQDGVDGVILAQRVRRYFPGGYLVTSPGEESRGFPRIAGVVEKPGEGNEPSDLVNIVAHVHRKPQRLLTILEGISSDRDDAYELALTKLCQELHYVAAPFEGRWDAIKYPWHILDITERFLGEIGGNFQFPISNFQSNSNPQFPNSGVNIHPTAVIEGPVVLEEGVKVLSHATIKGPCYIGHNSVVGSNCLVLHSIIGEGCVLGFSSEVVRSHFHSHVWTHKTFLGDSVIGHNVAFGAGSIVANFRLDEGEISSVVKEERVNTQRTKLGIIVGSNVRIGIHTSFAPGVKIGGGSFINSAVDVTRDVPDSRYVTVREGILEERENRTTPPGIRTERLKQVRQ